MSVSPKLMHASKVMAWLSAAGFILAPLMTAYVFLAPGKSGWMALDIDHLGAAINATVPLAYRLIALGCALVPVGFEMWALWALRRLFILYTRGQVFTQDALTSLNHIALALFLCVVAGFLMAAPMTAALSWSLGPGHRAVSLSFGSNDVATLFLAGAVLVIARVMSEARRVADENAGFV